MQSRTQAAADRGLLAAIKHGVIAWVRTNYELH
jgi:hypothetical protein